MRINVAEVKLEIGNRMVVPLTLTLEPMEMGGLEVKFDQPFTGEAEIWNLGDRLLVKAFLQGEATLPCSRCLTPFNLPLDVEFEEEYIEGQPGDLPVAEDEDEEEILAEERALSYYSGDEIDLSEPARDSVLLELPMQPLHSEDCEGLWAEAEKAQGATEDSSDRVDPRLAKLKDLLNRPDSKN